MRNLGFGLATSAIAFALIFVGAEIFVRIYHDGRFSPRPMFMAPHDTLGQRISPNLDQTYFGSDFSMEIETSEWSERLGARGPVPPDAPVAVLLGDSFTFGWGVDGDETFASYFDELLREISPELRAINLGIGGYGTLEYAERHRELLERRALADIRAVFVLHTHNDASDNLKNLLFTNGYNETGTNPKYSAHSSSHLLNYVTYTRHLLSLKDENERLRASAGRGIRQDILNSTSFKRTNKAVPQLVIGDGRSIPTAEIELRRTTSAGRTLESLELTSLQRELIELGIERINCPLGSAGPPVVHVLLSNAPAWYKAEMQRIYARAETCGTPVEYVAKLEISLEGFVGRQSNTHSSRHFTPAYNRLFAGIILDSLRPFLE